ncbi:MAG: hypothetical protein IE933_05880 [Sphingomonadales bacterium]|nr:hypothetical protein [Sphingomonadales bacterium]
MMSRTNLRAALAAMALLVAPAHAQSETVTFPVAAPAPSAEQADDAVGEYRDVNSFEMFHGLLLRADGTFAYALSVGALDRRSAGTWVREGDVITLTTDPKPVAPEFVAAPDDGAAGAPYLIVTWPDGDGIAGVDVLLGCGDGTQISDYTQYDGWSPGAGTCPDPQWVELEEGIHQIRSPRFPVAGRRGGLHFVLEPHDFGVADLTGTQGVLKEGKLVLTLGGQSAIFERVTPD